MLVEQALESFQSDMNRIRIEYQNLIEGYEGQIGDKVDAFHEFASDMIDSTAGHLGANIANTLLKEEDQERAISAVESWFSSNIQNGPVEQVLACGVWSLGAKGMTELISRFNAPAPKPA